MAIIGDDGDAAGQDGGHEHEHPDSFSTLDTDGNNELSWEEMENYLKTYHNPGEEEDTIKTIVSEIFQEDDKNKDGVISFEEYSHSAEEVLGEDDEPEYLDSEHTEL